MAGVAASIVGKVPQEAEFVRLNAASPMARYLLRWLEQGISRLHLARGALPSGPVRFVLTAPGERSALVGVLAASQDSLGRHFPLAVFQEVPEPLLSASPALLQEASLPFLEAGEALLQQAAALTPAALQQHAAALPALGPQDVQRAQAPHQARLRTRRCSELLHAVCGDQPPEARYYPLHALLTACFGERPRQHDMAQVVLDCPFPAALGPGPWLELSARLLRWASLPSFLWQSSPSSRLLLCLGAAPPNLLVHLPPSARAESWLWPLRTEKPAAMALARQALPPALRRLLDSPSSTLEQLAQLLST